MSANTLVNILQSGERGRTIYNSPVGQVDHRVAMSVCKVLRIASLTSKLHDHFKSYENFNNFFCPWLVGLFWIWNQSTVDNGEVSRGRSVVVGVSDRCKVTCDMWHVTCHTWNVTRDMWHMIFLKKKSATKFQKSHKKCHKRKTNCLPYAGFFKDCLILLVFERVKQETTF